MAGLFDVLQRGLRDRAYREPEAILPVEARASAPSAGYSFGLPWPWTVGRSDDLIDAAGRPLAPGEGPDVVVTAPRADGRSAMLTTRLERGPVLDVDTIDRRDELSQLERRHGGRRHPVRRVRLAGARAVLLSVSGAHEYVAVLVAEAPAGHLVGHLTLPLDQVPGYLSHVDVMLATWAWAS